MAFFSTEQADEVRAMLAPFLQGKVLTSTVELLDSYCNTARMEIEEEARNPGRFREWREELVEYYSAIGAHARALELLVTCHDLKKHLYAAADIDWSALEGLMGDVADGAISVATSLSSRSAGRGRHPLWWRDRLIVTAYTRLPEGMENASRISECARLIEKLLEYLGTEIADVRGVVRDAIARARTEVA